MLYLNHAGTSWPKPAPVQRAVSEALQSSPRSWAEAFASQHRAVASAFGISDPERLLLTPGCTAALNVGIEDHPWQPGDRIVTSGWEHHALLRPVLGLAARGVEHVVVGPDGRAPLDLAQLERVLGGGRVRMVAMSAAANVTGAVLPVDELTRLAHAHGAMVLLDVAQLAGWVDLDVAELDVDLLAFAGHKGLQAPWGVGGLYVAPRVEMSSPRRGSEPAPTPGYCDTGSVDRLALAGLVAGLAWLDAPEQRERLARARAALAQLTDRLEELAGVTLHGPRAPSSRMPTLALTVEGWSASGLASALAARGVIVSGGRQCAPLAHETLGTAAEGVVRLSVGPRAPVDLSDRLLETLGSVLEGARQGPE
ncbi:Cysteine desulfurase [Enhygromyxa salina]|uniref:Cysteine desulfurase n=1 Tax=Enhygromyxa salina TaxID=215803 RepID=A0A2S9YF46_9BACT|nr:aminotransferase class V-fold PLP-dependent enzyme [Enhygromyxa salina]PRQ03737.1 Cysteine desulfurase [Enhygromyxa salina]